MNLNLDILEQENLIGMLKLIEIFEQKSPYGHARDRVEHRFSHALSMLPEQHRQAALAIFATTLYLPQQMLEDAWRFLWNSLCKREDRSIKISEMVVLELDRDLIRDEFYRVNSIPGRLQDNAPWKSANDMIDYLATIKKTGKEQDKPTELFSDMVRRPSWVLLVDLSISGTSAVSEVLRLQKIAKLIFRDKAPSIVALVQVATERAIDHFKENNIDYLCAIQIPLSCALNSGIYDIIKDDSLRAEMKELCQWFAEEHILHTDYRLAQMAKENEDIAIAAFGFGKLGWSIVTYKNVPNNSLPILWFRPPNDQYIPPFERIDSRIGETWSGRKEWLNNAVKDGSLQKIIRKALNI